MQFFLNLGLPEQFIVPYIPTVHHRYVQLHIRPPGRQMCVHSMRKLHQKVDQTRRLINIVRTKPI